MQKECLCKQAWGKYHFEKEEGKPITVLIPSDLIIVFDFMDFANIYVDEVCTREITLSFNESDILEQLDKLINIKPRNQYNNHPTMQYITDAECEYVKNAIISRNPEKLYKYKKVIDDSIYLYNEYLLTKKLRMMKNKTIVAKKLCNLRISTIIMYLEFATRGEKVTLMEREWQWQCKVNDALRQMAAVEHEDNTLMLQYEIADDMMIEGFKYGIISPEVNYKDEYIDDTTNPYDVVEKMQIYESPKAISIIDDIDVQFHEMMMYKQLNYRKPITYIDATFAARKTLYIELILKFKKLFPEYICKCEIIEQNAEINSNIWIPTKYNCKFNKPNKFNKFTLEDDFQLYRKVIENKVSYIKNQGKNPCILTYKSQIKAKDNTLFGCPALHYGSAGGINKFENNDVLVVIGTYRPPRDWFKKQWDMYYGAQHGKMPSLKWTVDKENRTSYPTDDRLSQLFHDLWIPKEIENIIHRVRPTRHDVDIYWFGYNIPESFKNLFNIRFF
jgi:hypothetical protein